jgi:hypothetical protein
MPKDRGQRADPEKKEQMPKPWPDAGKTIFRSKDHAGVEKKMSLGVCPIAPEDYVISQASNQALHGINFDQRWITLKTLQK